jgi:predicted ATPase
MSPLLQAITVKNFRAIQHARFQTQPINVLFGPNGAGKSTFLDAINFLRDCYLEGPGRAASDRHHGIGLITETESSEDDQITIGVETESAIYEVSFAYSSGRIEAFVGEQLTSKPRGIKLLQRSPGSTQATMYHDQLSQTMPVQLADPDRLALSAFMLFSQPGVEATEINALLRSLHFYGSRSINLYNLRRIGSEGGVHTYPFDRWQNLWSALRNLQGRQAVDDRYSKIAGYMREAFPSSFKDLLIEPLGPERVGGSLIEPGRRSPIAASGVSDGHLQLLGLLVSLFGDTKNRSSIILFDEPETSLHPHAITTFARAVIEACAGWERQVFIATHSPVLLSQFKPEEIVLASLDASRTTTLTRLTQVEELQDLLAEYSVGTLYMAEALGPQGVVPRPGGGAS